MPSHQLADAVRAMRFEVDPRPFALVGFPEPPEPADLAALGGTGPAKAVREGGETTILLAEEDLEELLARHPTASVERGLRWVRFEHAMAWDLVGFLALVTGRLAEAGVPLGAVSGFSRDHLFLAEPHLATALRVLEDLFPPPADRSGGGG